MEVNGLPEQRLKQKQRIRARSVRRVFSGLNAGTAIALLLALVAMLNYLSGRNYLRFDLSRDQFYHLSEKTVSLLDALPGRVTITVFIQPGHEVFAEVYPNVVNLLREYEYAANGKIATVRIDPDRNLSRAEDTMARYGLDRPNVVIFEHGERRKTVEADELIEIDYNPNRQADQTERVSFRGEEAFSAAILSITEERPPRVYFMQGHGERSFDDRDEYIGLSGLGKMIRRDDVELLPFTFTEKSVLPDDADALVIAGPTRRYANGELERISDYVDRAGRLVLLLNAKTDAGFGPMLESWGIESRNNVVVDPSRTLSGFDLLVSEYANHPVTEGLHDIITLYYWPRALPFDMGRPIEDRAVDEYRASALALSSANAWAELNLEQRPYAYDDDTDIKGPVPIAAAVEKGSVESLAMDIRPTRVAIFGDVDFVSNSGLSGGNSDFFLNALNWVLEREQLIALAPRPVEETRLLITSRQLSLLFVVLVIGLPVLAAASGVIVWYRRRY